uniref:Heat shock protein 902 n=1 Tax=Dugesia japonica TaxID=6161 RepID=A0A2R4NBU5_DUGJA|nr:heat shock protein 902 [Dugesia japonica]
MKQLCYLCLIILVFSVAFRSADKNLKAESNDESIEKQTNDMNGDSKHENDLKLEPKVEENIVKSKESSKTDDEVIKREEEAISIDGLNVSQIKELRDKAEKFTFKAEVDRMMKLIINSLYKNKEIFLRELISNASDALDKIRFISLTNQDKNFDNEDLYIKIKADKIAKTIHIRDTGIGMTKNELINNLGTIAKSGTSDFIKKLSEAKNSVEMNELIGQFGVGFYSSFLVADRVTVISKSEADHQYIWESDASSFTIARDPRGDTLERGTEVILHLKDEVLEFLEIDVLSNLIHKYSQFINFPIYLWKSSVKNVEDVKEVAVTKNDEDANVENETDKRSVEKTVWDWELVNKNKPIWTRKTGETSDDEYNEFYKSFSKDTENPLSKTHFTAEGEVSFKAILYVPKKSNIEINNIVEKKNDNIKLYVKRVFITDDFDDIMPKYLSFIKGIIDSDDLPLNVSRETLQQHKLLKLIKKKLVRKTLDMLKKMPEDVFKEFWKEYATNIKLGAIEDVSNRNRLAKLLKFWSSHSEENLTSLSDYISRMKPNQDKIFFIAGVSLADVQLSPMVETLLKDQYEVLYLIEPVDEYTLQSIPEFEGKKFQNVAKEGFKLDDSDKRIESREKLEKEYENLNNWLKTDVLKDYVEKVEISERLTSSPCVLIATTYGWSGNMERIMKAQAYQKSDEVMQNYQVNQKKILEINPRHPLIRQLKYSLNKNQNINETRALAKLLYDTALLRSGYILNNVASFSKQVDTIIRTSMKIPHDENIIDDEEIMEDTFKEPVTEKSEDENKKNDKFSAKDEL